MRLSGTVVNSLGLSIARLAVTEMRTTFLRVSSLMAALSSSAIPLTMGSVGWCSKSAVMAGP